MSITVSDGATTVSAKGVSSFWSSIYLQVLIAAVAGVLLGWYFPEVGTQMKILGDFFIRCVQMVLLPIIFLTITVGIARMTDIKKLGAVGFKTILYFEVVSTLALAAGLIVGNLVQPGAGFNVDISKIDASSIATYQKSAATLTDTVFNLVPDNIFLAMSKGQILPVLVFSVLFGIGLSQSGKYAKFAVEAMDGALHGFFYVMHIVMRLAPIGAFGALAFTIGKYGVSSVVNLAMLAACVYLTAALFILVVFGAIARIARIPFLKFLHYIRAEIAIVLGTCSSESVLPQLMEKLERAGCSKPIVGLVMPSGITFNADGSAIYLSLAALFIAQATNTHLPLSEQIGLLAVLLVTSKGSAGVAGAAFIALAATLATTHTLPVAGLALLLGVDRFMNEARAVTNTVGNAFATLVISRWEGELDDETMMKALNSEG
jgi:aerobic C4-dicarboxylate transport protein